MANRTAEKRRRMYDADGSRRAVTLPPEKTRFKACKLCRQPMPLGVGQIAFYHADCRKQRRHRYQSTIIPSRQLK